MEIRSIVYRFANDCDLHYFVKQNGKCDVVDMVNSSDVTRQLQLTVCL